MARVRKRVTINAFILGIIIVSLMVVEAAGSFLLLILRTNGDNDKINKLTAEITKNKKVILVSNVDISCGQELTNDMFTKTMAYASAPQQAYLAQSDIDSSLGENSEIMKTGCWALIDIKAGTPVMKTMIADEKISHDLRREEFNSFLLQSDILKNQFIDIRIVFADGENYIILCKKKVRDLSLEKNTIWLWLDDKEILTISSAIVDAYIHKGSKIYIDTYVAPSMQKVAIPTYPVNQSVLALIKSDPNILAEAKVGLNEQVRAALDTRLGTIPATAIANIQAGVSQEEAERNAKIQTDSTTKQQLPQSGQEQSDQTNAKQTFFN